MKIKIYILNFISNVINPTLAEGSKLLSSFGGGLDFNLIYKNQNTTPNPISYDAIASCFLDSPARGELRMIEKPLNTYNLVHTTFTGE